jgi:hypothetical protein
VIDDTVNGLTVPTTPEHLEGRTAEMIEQHETKCRAYHAYMRAMVEKVTSGRGRVPFGGRVSEG